MRSYIKKNHYDICSFIGGKGLGGGGIVGGGLLRSTLHLNEHKAMICGFLRFPSFAFADNIFPFDIPVS